MNPSDPAPALIPDPMSDPALAPLCALLKPLLLEAVEQSAPDGGLRDDEPLFGPEARFNLDSLDALQISMAIQGHFGVRMPDSKETRKALRSIVHLARHLSERGVKVPG